MRDGRRFAVVVKRPETEEYHGSKPTAEDERAKDRSAYEAESMVWVSVAVGSHVYVLDERRAFVGHGGCGLFIACQKLHE